jgi:hypothetical protein
MAGFVRLPAGDADSAEGCFSKVGNTLIEGSVNIGRIRQRIVMSGQAPVITNDEAYQFFLGRLAAFVTKRPTCRRFDGARAGSSRQPKAELLG